MTMKISKSKTPPQGDVEYVFLDGWTMQALVPRGGPGSSNFATELSKLLRAEGESMQISLGMGGMNEEPLTLLSWSLMRGEAFILSLRDPAGRPHVTIEVGPDGKFLQVMGKRALEPKEEYGCRLLEYVAVNKARHKAWEACGFPEDGPPPGYRKKKSR